MYILELSLGVTETPVLSLVLLVSSVPGSSARPPEAPGSSVPHLRQQQRPTPPTADITFCGSVVSAGAPEWILVARQSVTAVNVDCVLTVEKITMCLGGCYLR